MSICNCTPCTSATCPNAAASATSTVKKTSNHETFTDVELRVGFVIALIFTAFCLLRSINQQTTEKSFSKTYGIMLSGMVDELVALRSEAYLRKEEYDGRIHDISHKIQPNIPSWGSKYGTGQVVSFSESMKNESDVNFSEIKLSTHTGTHVHAPGHVFDHYFDARFDVDTLDLATLNGPAMLVDVPKDTKITARVMMSLNISRGVKRVLFRTLNTARHLMWKREFDESYVGFTKGGAKWLVDNTDIKLVGIDYLSAAAYDDLIPSYHVFLESREIILVEGLKLDNIDAGVYTVHCLPLRLVGAEGSPLRCILVK